MPLAGEVFAGACAGTCQVVVTNPLEVVKVGLQTDPLRRPVFELISEIGLSGLWRGAGACICRDATFSSILFPTYAHAKLALAAAGQSSPLALALAGFVAATPAAFLTTPADVVKTRMQQCDAGGPAATLRNAARGGGADGGEGGAGGAAAPDLDAGDEGAGADQPCYDLESLNVLELGAAIAQEEGRGALFSGALERVLRSAPQFAVTLALYDVLTQYCVGNGWLPTPG